MDEIKLQEEISADRIEKLINQSISNISEIMDDLNVSQYECASCKRIANYQHGEAQSFSILRGIIAKLNKTKYLLIDNNKQSRNNKFVDPEMT